MYLRIDDRRNWDQEDRDQNRLSQSTTVVYYLSAPCASGKTYALACHICTLLGTVSPETKNRFRLGDAGQPTGHFRTIQTADSYIAALLTKDMCSQFIDELKARGLDETRIMRIDSVTHENQVVSTLTDALKNFGGLGIVVVCTHEAFFRLPYFQKTGWKVFIDEIPPAERAYSPNIPESAAELAEWLRIEDGDSEFARILPNNFAKLKHRLEELTDDWKQGQKAVFQEVLSPFKEVFVARRDWARLVDQKNITKKSKKDRTQNRLQFIYAIKPESLDGFTIMGADFPTSTLFAWLRAKGVQLVPAKELSRDLRFQQHPSRDIEIYYAFKKKRFSLHLRNKENFKALRLYEKAILVKLEQEGVSAFLLHGNADYISGKARDEKTKTQYNSVLPRDHRCIPLPVTPHGLNRDEFQNCNTVVCVGAFNRTSDIERFLRSHGVEQKVLCDTHYQQVYQAVCRSNIRIVFKGESGSITTPSEKIVIFVPDQGTAEYLAARFPGSRVIRLEGDFKQYDAMDPAERRSRLRQKQGQNEGQLSEGAAGNNKECNCHDSLKGFTKEIVTSFASRESEFRPSRFLMTPRDYIVAVTLLDYKEKRHVAPTTLRPFSLLISDFEVYMEHQHLSKGEAFLYNLTAFDNTGMRRLSNFIGSDGVILECDDGVISLLQACAILRQYCVRHFGYSSLNACPAHPNKWHLVVPLADTATSKEQHAAAVEFLVTLLQHETGYSREALKIDAHLGIRRSSSIILGRTNATRGLRI